jgi:glucose-6-phosphate dehydrogenase assembly protein OpcA
VALEGLKPHYVNNAIAALRLSSLPTVVWWRGGAEETLDGLSTLADRLVLDAEDPRAVWARVSSFDTATTDLRWTRLTRWRALMAHFFDIPEVRAAAPSFRRLRIDGADLHAARLFAAWLRTTVKWMDGVEIELHEVAGPLAIESVQVGNGDQSLSLRTGPGGGCIESAARVAGAAQSSRTVLVGDQGLAALIGEELRIRSRDLAFDRAVAAVGDIA